MVRFKGRQHFQVSSGKIDFFAEAGAKKVSSFISKENMYFSDQGTDYLEIYMVSICFKNFKTKNGAPNWPNFQNVENACKKIGQLWAPFWDLNF